MVFCEGAAFITFNHFYRFEKSIQDSKVQIPSFGSFEVRECAARLGRNSLTGKAIEIAAVKVPAYKAGKGRMTPSSEFNEPLLGYSPRCGSFLFMQFE